MNFQPEWGYLTNARSFRGAARIVIVAIVVSATMGAGVLLSLVDRPLVTIGETSLAARMLARPFEPESTPVKTRQAAQMETQAVIEDWFVKPGAAKSDDGVLVPSEPSTNSPAEVPAPTAAMAELQTTGDTPPAKIEGTTTPAAAPMVENKANQWNRAPSRPRWWHERGRGLLSLLHRFNTRGYRRKEHLGWY